MLLNLGSSHANCITISRCCKGVARAQRHLDLSTTQHQTGAQDNDAELNCWNCVKMMDECGDFASALEAPRLCLLTMPMQNLDPQRWPALQGTLWVWTAFRPTM
eukprot:3767257-Amphidinium_carterae.1